MTKVTFEIGHGPFRDRNGNTGFEEGADGPGTTEHKEVTIMATMAGELLRQQGYMVDISDPSDTLPDSPIALSLIDEGVMYETASCISDRH